MVRFKACKSSQSNHNPTTFRAIGIAEIAIGVFQMLVAERGAHALFGVGATFISIGVIFLCRARQAPSA